VHSGNENAFQAACGEGRLPMVRRLLSLGGDREVHAATQDNEAFVGVCGCGWLGPVRELLALEGERAVDVRAQGDLPLKGTLFAGRTGVLCELISWYTAAGMLQGVCAAKFAPEMRRFGHNPYQAKDIAAALRETPPITPSLLLKHRIMLTLQYTAHVNPLVTEAPWAKWWVPLPPHIAAAPLEGEGGVVGGARRF